MFFDVPSSQIIPAIEESIVQIVAEKSLEQEVTVAKIEWTLAGIRVWIQD